MSRIPSYHGERHVFRSAAALGLIAIALVLGSQYIPTANNSAVRAASSNIIEKTNTIRLSTDWKICAEIQPGEGIFPALQRAAKGQTPSENRGGLINNIEYMNKKTGEITVYSYEDLLGQTPKVKPPIVQPGDIACDTNKPYLGPAATAIAANKK